MKLPFENFRPRGFLRTLLLTALLFLTCNLLLLAVFPFLTPLITVGITNAKWKMVERPDGFSGGILLGDSTAFMCIEPDILERETGIPWMNMGTYGDFGTFDDALMLSRMIEKGWDIKGVVVVHSYDSLHRELTGQTLADIPWYLRLPWRTLPAKLQSSTRAEALYRDMLPLFYRQEALTRLFKKKSFTLVRMGSRFESGYLEPDGQKPNLGNDVPDHLEHLRLQPMPAISDSNRQSIAALVATAAKYRIPVLFVSGPILDTVGNTPEYQRVVRVIDSQITSAAAGKTAVKSGYLDEAVFPAKDMDRVDHVNFEAVGRFTGHVARQWNRFRASLETPAKD